MAVEQRHMGASVGGLPECLLGDRVLDDVSQVVCAQFGGVELDFGQFPGHEIL